MKDFQKGGGQKQKFDKKFFGFVLLVFGPLVLGALLYFSGFGADQGAYDVSKIASYIRGFGIGALLLSLTLNVLQTFVVFMPSVLLSGINAIVFGLFWGTIVSWAGEVIGAVIAFLAYRYLGRETVAGFARQKSYLQRINEFSSTKGFRAVLILRLVPAVPSGLVNLLAGISAIKFGSFLAATALGKLPSLVLETFIGHDLFTWRENYERLILLLILVVIIYIVFKNKRSGA